MTTQPVRLAALSGEGAHALRAIAPSATILVDRPFSGSPDSCRRGAGGPNPSMGEGHGGRSGRWSSCRGERRMMTITSGAPVTLGRRPSSHRFIGHRPVHRRRVTPTGRIIASASFVLSVLALPFSGWSRSLRQGDCHAWGILVAVVAWVGLVACHLAGVGPLTAVFAAIGALTWGQAAAAFTPTEDGIEYYVISTVTSAACLVLVGMILVELQLTNDFFRAFVGIGVLSLLFQVVAFAGRSAGRSNVASERASGLVEAS